MEVKFYSETEDNLLKFAVIVSRSNGKWVFCKHRERSTYECPGGHREMNEKIIETAKRELFEETGASVYTLTPISVYSVVNDDTETFGMLYFADIKKFDELPELEIEKIEFFDEFPDSWTYPQIQPKLIKKAITVLKINSIII